MMNPSIDVSSERVNNTRWTANSQIMLAVQYIKGETSVQTVLYQ